MHANRYPTKCLYIYFFIQSLSYITTSNILLKLRRNIYNNAVSGVVASFISMSYNCKGHQKVTKGNIVIHKISSCNMCVWVCIMPTLQLTFIVLFLHLKCVHVNFICVKHGYQPPHTFTIG